MKLNGRIEVADGALDEYCHRWRITQIELFGSALRDDFGQDSDVDVLVTFEKGAPWSLYDLIEMREELEAMLGRSVDLVERAAVERSGNPFRRHSILSTAQVVYRVAR